MTPGLICLRVCFPRSRVQPLCFVSFVREALKERFLAGGLVPVVGFEEERNSRAVGDAVTKGSDETGGL